MFVVFFFQVNVSFLDTTQNHICLQLLIPPVRSSAALTAGPAACGLTAGARCVLSVSTAKILLSLQER